MNAVGKFGSYISRSVYIASGPFHPFGGAVDIIVVEQPDGSFKSSPWYVRFGKFQGFLQAREKLVTVCVNGVEADFRMYIDHKGEAYFLREIEVEVPDISLSPSSVEDTDGGSHIRSPMKSTCCNDEAHVAGTPGKTDASVEKTMSRVNSRRCRISGPVSRMEDGFSGKKNGSSVVRTESLERAEIAADLLEVKWCTNLVFSTRKKNGFLRLSSLDISEGNDVNELKTDTQNIVESHTQDTIGDNVKDDFPLLKIKPADEEKGHSVISILRESEEYGEEAGTKSSNFGSKYLTVTPSTMEADHPVTMVESSENENWKVDGADTGSNMTYAIPEVIYTDTHSHEFLKSEACHDSHDSEFLKSEACPVHRSPKYWDCDDRLYGVPHASFLVDGNKIDSTEAVLYTETSKISWHELSTTKKQPTGIMCVSSRFCEQSVSETSGTSDNQNSGNSEVDLLFGDLDDSSENETRQMKDPIFQDHEKDAHIETPGSQIKTDANEVFLPNLVYSSSAEMSAQEDLHVSDKNLGIKLKTVSSEINISGSLSEEVRAARSLPNMWISDICESGNFTKHVLHSEYFPSKHTFLVNDYLNNVEPKVYNDHQPSKSPHPTQDSISNQELKTESGSPVVGNSSRPVDASSGNWRFRPSSFRRSRIVEDSESAKNAMEDVRDMPKVKVTKMKVRESSPSSAQLASLNLKEGRNTVTFTFSTPMLGKQKVDAQIHLWKWDTCIVISDVDGTITRSDLLGQVMPWVGVDWLQTGVADLFSAIKENGYQVLFLSARAISQSYHTRQFIFNLKQDGKALPEGPVVISPDGIFPSLYREVVRRTPHEFKISCLEAIKALFPSDRNPFYAGFGNRESDEMSYLKVGIPKGKIFIINPKGEIVVNHHVDRKSYTCFHALVNDMFPLMSSSEQEDYNSWNYWKLPLPPIQI